MRPSLVKPGTILIVGFKFTFVTLHPVYLSSEHLEGHRHVKQLSHSEQITVHYERGETDASISPGEFGLS